MTVGGGYGRTSGAARPLAIGLGRIQGGDFGGSGGVMEHVMEVVQMGHQVFPEGHFGGAVVVTNTRLQANMQVHLIVWVVLRPGHLFEAVSFSVDEFGVLRHRLVGIPVNT